jgi:predicted transcriptional regulator YheO
MSAEVAGRPVTGEIGTRLVDQRLGPHHDAGREEPALERAVRGERPSHAVALVVVTGSGGHAWARAEKQTAVRLLSERGAFLLGGVEDVTEIMGVSRITIYNYLNALEEPSR